MSNCEPNNLSSYIGISTENELGASVCFEYPITLEIFLIALIVSVTKG